MAMHPTPPRPVPSPTPARSLVFTGAIALAIAMGIGRFAFTPLMPLMLRDGTLDAATGTEWAAANYLGYLLGALTASRFARNPLQGLKLGLVGVVLATAGIAWTGASLAWTGAALRGAAGVFSAWVLVCASSWCLPALARAGSAALGGWIYTGVGLGIALTGTMAWLGGHQRALLLWLELGVLAALGTGHVLRSLAVQAASAGAQAAPSLADSRTAPPAMPAARGQLGLVLCYGTFGFGYIIPATFLPTMARQLVSDPLVFGLTWPIFGTAAALSVALAARWFSHWPRRKLWAGA